MKINYGLKSGAVLQRNRNNFCECTFGADSTGEINTSLGKITQTEKGTYLLSDIPVGGPYNIRLWDDNGEVTLSDIYVGDLWLLAGQSNMEGAGKWREKYQKYDANPSPTVRAYYMNETWSEAKSQLHQLWESADECISVPFRNDRKNSRWGCEYPETQNNGVGPGLFFASEMQSRTNGVPQGVIPCGIGGSALWQWNPDGENNYYTAAKRRVRECGGNIKGVFWHQGESQAMGGAISTFVSEMQHLVVGMRKDFNSPKLPFVQVQIHKYAAAGAESDICWNAMREIQRTLETNIDNLSTVYSLDLELDDLIHLASESHEILGKRAAEAMDFLTSGNGSPSPALDSVEIIQDDYVPFFYNIRVNYKNISGSLTANGIPSGFAILDNENGSPLRAISRTCLEGDSVRIKVELDCEKLENAFLCYGYGNTFYCNITDSENRSIPGFGPIKIKELLKKENN